jgi:hypothetical protein
MQLIQFKKSGYLFIKENISDLEISQPFEIYYAPTRGGITYKNAFPISIRAYFEKEIVSILAT